MASVGSKILASDYNAVQTAIANVLGTGSGTFGYGQSLSSSSISGNPKITATQWNNLRSDLVAAYTHQNSPGSLSIPSVVPVGGSINYSDYIKYQALSSACTTNANAVPTSSNASYVVLSTGTNTTPWNSSKTHTVTLTFSSQNSARYYFNAGGYITFSASLINYPGYPGFGSPDGSYSKNSDWNTLLNGVGTITFNYNYTTTSNPGGSNQTILSNVGYYQLTTSQQNIYSKITTSSTYTPNQYDIYASVNGGGNVITFSIQFKDLSTSSGHDPSYAIDEYIEGTLTSLVQGYYASGTYVSVTPPTVSYTFV